MSREGADELTLRAEEEEEGMLRTFTDTADVGDCRWSPPFVDEDWHDICQAIFQGVEGSELEAVYYNYKELHKAVQRKKSGEKQEGQGRFGFLKEAKDKGVFYDLGSVQKIQTRPQARLDLWAIHLKSLTAALADALKRTEQSSSAREL